MDPSLPTARALAIAGDRIVGGVGVHETALASPETVDLAGLTVLPGFTDSHVHFAQWSLAQRQVRLEGVGVARRGGRARGRGRPRGPAGTLAARPRLAERRVAPAGRADPAGPRRGHGRRPDRADGQGRPLDLDQLGRARGRERRPPGARRRRRAGRARRADRRPPRGVRLALPRDLRPHARRRVGRRDARRDQARQRARRHGRARQGRLDGDPPLVADAARRGLALAARLAVAPVGAAARDRRARPALRDRRRPAPDRLHQGLHGRHARVEDGPAAGRLRRRDHEPRAVRGHRPPRGARRVPGRRPRDRRPGEPRRARRLRGGGGGMAPEGPPPADRARAARRRGGLPPLRRDRDRGLGAVLARPVRPRSRRRHVGRA